MAAIIHGTRLTFGISEQEITEYAGFPLGARVKVRFRSLDFATAIVKLPDGRVEVRYVEIDKQGVCHSGPIKAVARQGTVQPVGNTPPKQRKRMIEAVA